MVQFIVVSEGYFMIALALHWNAFRFNSGKFPPLASTKSKSHRSPVFSCFSTALFDWIIWLSVRDVIGRNANHPFKNWQKNAFDNLEQ